MGKQQRQQLYFSQIPTWVHGITYIIYVINLKSKKALIKEQVFVYTWMRMYVSSCKFVDMRIDIVKYEEGFFICCQDY